MAAFRASRSERLKLILGSKLEYNEYTGVEIQPSIRALWAISDKRSLWSAVSRAVRTPSRADTDIQINAAVFPPGLFPVDPTHPTVVSVFGDRDLDSE